MCQRVMCRSSICKTCVPRFLLDHQVGHYWWKIQENHTLPNGFFLLCRLPPPPTPPQPLLLSVIRSLFVHLKNNHGYRNRGIYRDLKSHQRVVAECTETDHHFIDKCTFSFLLLFSLGCLFVVNFLHWLSRHKTDGDRNRSDWTAGFNDRTARMVDQHSLLQ